MDENQTKSKLQNDNILYIGSYMSEEMDDKYDIPYSLAGNNHIKGIIRSLGKTGANVTVVSTIWRESPADERRQPQTVFDRELGVNIHLPRKTKINFLSRTILTFFITLSVITELYKKDYDSVAFYNFYRETSVPALIGSTLFNIPLYVEFLDSYLHRRSHIHRLRVRLLHRLCGIKLNGAICVSTTLEEIAPIDHNIHIVRGFPSIGFPNNLKNKSTIKNDDLVVTFAGRFDSLRGISQFLEVAESLSTKRGDIEFWICGYGPRYQEVAQRVEKMPKCVKFLGTLEGDNYIRHIISSDILVNFQDPTMPDSNYVFPSKLLDFMSSGNIIISTPVSDVAEHLGEILVITGNNTTSMEKDTIDVIENTEKYTNKSQKGPMWIRQNCSYEYVAERLEEMMQ